ncbi:MAG: MerR family transcriptional regulator [Cellulomonas sp.]|nr:MerR family transcriptional regulator [Cellulomonas sp.]
MSAPEGIVTSVAALARSASLTEKAVRIYLQRGLLEARDAGGGRRSFGPDQIVRARLIGLLRTIDLPLSTVRDVLDADDPVVAFDALWSTRRQELRTRLATAEQVRAALTAARRPPVDEIRLREVPEQLTLSQEVTADLAGVGDAIRGSTARLFEALGGAGVELAAAPYVEYPERATEGFTARLVVHAPVVGVLRPPGPGFRLSVAAAHLQAYVPLSQDQADDRELLVAVHDHLSTGAFAVDLMPVGANREVYLPGFGTGTGGGTGTGTAEPVMEVAVPVDRR